MDDNAYRMKCVRVNYLCHLFLNNPAKLLWFSYWR